MALKLALPPGCRSEVQMRYGSIGWSVGAALVRWPLLPNTIVPHSAPAWSRHAHAVAACCCVLPWHAVNCCEISCRAWSRRAVLLNGQHVQGVGGSQQARKPALKNASSSSLHTQGADIHLARWLLRPPRV